MGEPEDVSEEIVEEMEDLKVDKPKPRRRMPRRAVSTDGLTPPSTRRKPSRTKSGDGALSPTGGLAPLRRTATDSGRVGRMGGLAKASSNRIMAMEKEAERAELEKAKHKVGRAKSNDDVAPSRNLPSRSKSGTLGPTRSAPKRTASGFGLRRTKSGDGTSMGGLRKGKKKEKAGSSNDTCNIFGSDMVSMQQVLKDIATCKENSKVTRLELEDFFMAEREDPDAIPLALKDLLETSDRPWESVRFMDDIMDASIYEEFRERRKHFLRTLAGVCESKLIPVIFKAKITLSSGSLSMEEMCDVLFYLRTDKAVVEMTIKSEQVDEGIIRALVEVFKADKRKWKSVSLQLSGTGPGKPGSAEHNTWAKGMQAATEEMQKVCKERGINLG